MPGLRAWTWGRNPPGVLPFLAHLKAGHTVEEATRAVGITRSTPYVHRRRNVAFREQWPPMGYRRWVAPGQREKDKARAGKRRDGA